MRWLGLYLRSRRVPFALATAVAMVAVVWAMCLAYADSEVINVRAISLTVMLAVAGLAPTLRGADDALDHTASINWPVRRAAHLLLIGVGIAALLALSTVTEARFAPFAVVLRDTVGLLGLTALGAATVGAARSWIVPVLWTLISVLPFIDPIPTLKWEIIGWLIQPPGTAVSTVCAAGFAVSGLLAYTVRGCPRHPATETVADG